jgi:hypothetical protein
MGVAAPKRKLSFFQVPVKYAHKHAADSILILEGNIKLQKQNLTRRGLGRHK